MFNAEDVAVDHYVGWDWRVVLAVVIVGMVSAGFSCWLSFSSGQRYLRDWPSGLSAAARLLPQYVAVLCVWLGASRLESWRSAFWVYLFLAALLSFAFWRSYLAVGLWGARTCFLCGALVFTALAASWEVLRRAAATIPMTVSGLVGVIVLFVAFAVISGSRR
mgnify:CR=1 FL=1